MPHRQFPMARERLLVARTLIEITKGLQRTYANPGEPLGTTVELLFVGICVFIGHLENRPMSASMVARFLEIPRTTAFRRLDKLLKRGLVRRSGRLYYLNETEFNKRAAASIPRVFRAISKMGEELSKGKPKAA